MKFRSVLSVIPLHSSRLVTGIASVFAAAVFLTPESGFAQAAESDGRTLEEVTVTARRIEENLQDVPVAVTALSGERLYLTFAQNLGDVSEYAPNVNIGIIPGFKSVAIAIRGVSTGDSPSTFDPAVTVAVDGFFLGHFQSSLLDMFEVQQIEILRGPQGTLFGKNTIGGVINVTTRRPADEFGVQGKIRVANEGRLDVMGAIDIPIVDDKLAARIAIQSFNFDGYYTNSYDGSDAGGQDLLAGRAKLQWTPNENFDALLSFEWSEDESDTPMVLGTSTELDATGFYGSDFFYGAGYPGRGAGGSLDRPLGDPFVSGLVPRELHENRGIKDTQGHYEDILGVYLTLNWDVLGGTITSTTGSRDVDSDYYNDYVGEAAAVYSTIRSIYRETFSQELRYAASPTDRFNYVLGLYYQTNDLIYENYTSLGSAHPLSGILWPATGLLLTGDGGQDSTTWAVFGEGHYSLTERLRLTFGARYSDEEKDFNLRPIGLAESERATPSDSWSDTTWRLGLDYRINDNMLTYFTYSTGFKSGGYNEQATLAATAVLSFDPEEADSFEVGLKSDFLDGAMRLNLAAFYVEYTDLQLDSVIPVASSPIGQETVITNAGETTTYGLEAELLWQATERFTIDATLGYLDAEYDTFACDLDRDLTTGDMNGYEDCSVLDVKRTPDLQASLGATYDIPLGQRGGLMLNGRANYTDAFFNDIFNSVGSEHEDVTLLNASITYYNPDETVRVALYGRNITDEEYQTAGLGVANLWTFSIYGKPATYGMEVFLDF